MHPSLECLFFFSPNYFVYFPTSLPHCLIGSFLSIVSYVDPLCPLGFSHLYDSGCLENVEAFFVHAYVYVFPENLFFLYFLCSVVFNIHIDWMPLFSHCLILSAHARTHTHTLTLTLSHTHRSAKSLQSCPTLCNPWTVAHQTPLSMGFSRQEYWSGLPCPPPEDLPSPGIEPASPLLHCRQILYHWAIKNICFIYI